MTDALVQGVRKGKQRGIRDSMEWTSLAVRNKKLLSLVIKFVKNFSYNFNFLDKINSGSSVLHKQQAVVQC